MKYFKEIELLKELGKEGVLTEQEVLAGIDRFDPTLGSFHDKQGAMTWLESQNIINQDGKKSAPEGSLHKSLSIESSSFSSSAPKKLDWGVTLDEVYEFNSQQVATLLDEGAITQKQSKAALTQFKGYFYAFCWTESLIRWIRSDYKSMSIFEDTFDVSEIDSQTALQLFALYKNEVINVEEYLESYEMLSAKEDELPNAYRTFASATECFTWLVENEGVYHSLKDVQQAINYTHNTFLLSELEQKGVISFSCNVQVSDKLEEHPDFYFKDEQSLLEWVKQEGLFISEDPPLDQVDVKRAVPLIVRVIQVLMVCLAVWFFMK